MPGFPLRMTRSMLGPDPINRKPVRNPEKELDAAIAKLMFWQLGGSSLLVPLADMVCTQAGTAIPVVASHVEAFRPNADGPAPTMGRTGAGVYTFAYPATHADENATAQPLALRAGIAVPLVAAFRHGQVEINIDGISGTVRFWSDAGVTPADCAKFLVVLR